MDELDDDIMAVPRDPTEPRVKIRALYNYCKSKGENVKPSDLTREEMQQFLVWSDPKQPDKAEKP